MRRIPSSVVHAAVIAAGGLVLLGGVGLLLSQLEPKLAKLPSPSPGPNPLPGPRPPPRPSGPQRLVSDPVPLLSGQRYLAIVTVSSPLSWLATVAKVRGQAEKMGFRDVVVSESAPANWPPPARTTQGDYYVEATYTASPNSAARSQGGGRVTIVDAWQV